MNTILNFMRKNYKILLTIVFLSVSLFAFNIYQKKASNPEREKLLLELIAFVVERGHYDPKNIDDEFSKGVYKDFLEALDPSKRFFIQSDIDEFSKFEFKIDDNIKSTDLAFFDLTYNRLIQRMDESKAYYKEILDKPFDYSVNEEVNTDFEKIPFAKDKKELIDRWRKQIKLNTLASLTEKMKIQEDYEKGIKEPEKEEKVASKKDTKEEEKHVHKTFEEFEKESRESTLKTMDDYFSFVKDLDRDDWFSVFLNVIAERFDPHTNYFAPDDKEKFDVSMSGKFFGIGARLQKKNDYIEITELISGGPAWREKELEPGDLIMKVGQGKELPIDIAGMKMDEVVKKIKGPKGTEVRLTVKKAADGTIKVIKIVRDEVEIEETYAKTSVVEKNGNLYGVIYLPKFYIDFENKESRDAAKDIALEVERLKKQGVKGIALDLRDNGGGSLRTVVDIAGLFIDKGPIVQVKSAGKNQEVLSDTDSRVQWDGPLVIMINNFSASASEILAAAIQDYGRGIIIGSKQSYGKGTVQNVIDLNQFVRNNSTGNLGAFKTTTQKFYRINGGSTQLRGVGSDIIMPDRYSFVPVGERDSDNAMPWDKISPADYRQLPKTKRFDDAIAKSRGRVYQSDQFRLIEKNAEWLGKRKDDYVYSLNIEKYRKEEQSIETESKKYKAITDYKNNLIFNPIDYEVAKIEKDSVFKEKRKRWYESLAKDVYVEEALNILSDLQSEVIAKGPQTAKQKKKVASTF